MNLVGAQLFEEENKVLIWLSGDSIGKQKLIVCQEDSCLEFHLISFSMDVDQNSVAATSFGKGSLQTQTFQGIPDYSLDLQWEGEPKELDQDMKKELVKNYPRIRKFLTLKEL